MMEGRDNGDAVGAMTFHRQWKSMESSVETENKFAATMRMLFFSLSLLEFYIKVFLTCWGRGTLQFVTTY